MAKAWTGQAPLQSRKATKSGALDRAGAAATLKTNKKWRGTPEFPDG